MNVTTLNPIRHSWISGVQIFLTCTILFCFACSEESSKNQSPTVTINQSPPVTITDNEAPARPENIVIVISSSSQIDLSWAASTDNVGVTRYSITRGDGRIFTSNTNAYSDIGLSNDTRYTYIVTALDEAGNESNPSESVAITTPDINSNPSGFTTFEPEEDSIVIYVSSSKGNDDNSGTSPDAAVRTPTHAASLVRDNHYDFILLKRGDTWRGDELDLHRFKSGLDADHPMVIASYGESIQRPRLEVHTHFINHGGHVRNYVAVMGLQIVSYPKIPGDEDFDGDRGGAFRYVGGGTGFLIEDCHIIYGEIIVQSYGEGNHYTDVSLRRNIIEYSYHINTSGQNSTFRPSGMYASHVTGLTIEENIFDHNGWNDNVDTAGATMYNHNMYLNADNLIVRDNIIARASSMGIKMRSDTTGDADTLLFENNLFVDGEIGLGIGGNTDEPDRFRNVTIRQNVFSQIGMNNPTNRSFSWMLGVKDNTNTLIEDNYFLHQPWYDNAYGIQVGGGSGTITDIAIQNNTFYNLRYRGILVEAGDGWSDVLISNNTIVDPANESSLIYHTGSFDNVVYQDNNYYSEDSDNWFYDNGTRILLSEWIEISGESSASEWTGEFSDPDRTVADYAGKLGLEESLESFLQRAKQQSRLNWNDNLTAGAVLDYIRAGFEN